MLLEEAYEAAERLKLVGGPSDGGRTEFFRWCN
jgi:hypothetical protein